MDLVAKIDQAEKGASETTRPLIAFYNALKESGMDECLVREFTRMWAKRILEKK